MVQSWVKGKSRFIHVRRVDFGEVSGRRPLSHTHPAFVAGHTWPGEIVRLDCESNSRSGS
jgi:hypothetical protein